MTDLVKLAAANLARWQAMQVTPALVHSIDAVARKLLTGKNRYQALSAQSGVPWAVLAVIHEREASARWTCSLAQGDPWNAASIHDPKGRGPFASFEEAAMDALSDCAPHAAKWKDWSIGGALSLLEQYNGLGYAAGPKDLQGNHYPPQPSPYIWASTDQYVSGKYVGDGDYRPGVVDSQLGCASLLSRLFALDDTARFDGASAAIHVAPQPPASPMPPDPAPPVTGPSRDTKWLQDALNRCGADPAIVVDGKNGDATRAAIVAFQQESGLEVDGFAGPKTFAALDAALAKPKN